MSQTGSITSLAELCQYLALTPSDAAVLRPGRLTNHRRFELLSREAAERIAEDPESGFRPNQWSEDYTLAEILNPGLEEALATKPAIGFQP